MPRTAELEKVEFKGKAGDPDLTFLTRPGTSDAKAIREVVTRRGYARHSFTPGAGEHWVDLGANVGAFSVWAAAHDRSITVDAYEPDPVMCELIERNAKLNKVSKQVTVHEGAVVTDGRKKSVTLHCNTARGNVWRNSIERSWQGGEDIIVPAIPLSKVKLGDSWLKMDIEGTEMPILEHMLERFRDDDWPIGMVFEWSFDVDRSIERFTSVVAGLSENVYENVSYGGFDETAEEWQASWFPPCRLVYCWQG